MDVFVGSEFSKYYKEFPLVLIDIGARGGLQKNWNRAKKYLQIIGFEPDIQEFERLKRSARYKNIKYFNFALYKDRQVVDFYLTRNRGVCSIFKPNRNFLDNFPESQRYDIIEVVKLETDTIDNQFTQTKDVDIDFIKLDTQGSELGILEGGTKILDNSVFGLEIEVEFVELYERQPLFSDIDIFVRKHGFSLFDLRPFYWKRRNGKDYGRSKGQLIFADALYFKTPGSFKSVIDGVKDMEGQKSKLLKAISICIIYGYLDYALEIFKLKSDLFTENECELFLKEIKKQVLLSHKIPNFRGRGRIANILYSQYKIIHPEGRSWIKRGKVLGNLE